MNARKERPVIRQKGDEIQNKLKRNNFKNILEQINPLIIIKH